VNNINVGPILSHTISALSRSINQCLVLTGAPLFNVLVQGNLLRCEIWSQVIRHVVLRQSASIFW